MSQYIESSNYANSYGSINDLGFWDLKNGFFETDLITKTPLGNGMGCCSGGFSKGLGDITDFLSGSGMTLVAVAVGFYLLMNMGEGNKKKKAALKKASAEYKRKQKQIKDDYGVLGHRYYRKS